MGCGIKNLVDGYCCGCREFECGSEVIWLIYVGVGLGVWILGCCFWFVGIVG